MKTYDRRVSTRNSEGSSEVRKRMERGGQVTKVQIAPPDPNKRKGPDTIKPEFFDDYLTMIKRQAAALLKSFEQDTQMTPQQALKQKFRFKKKDKNPGFKPDKDNREA